MALHFFIAQAHLEIVVLQAVIGSVEAYKARSIDYYVVKVLKP